jgi:hypothetical protein
LVAHVAGAVDKLVEDWVSVENFGEDKKAVVDDSQEDKTPAVHFE